MRQLRARRDLHPRRALRAATWNGCSIILGMVGAARGWKIVPVASSGQISNVSAFVLPERMPVADDGQQRMFPELDKLLEIERLRLERERLKLLREEARAARRHANKPVSTSPPESPPRPKPAYRPQDKKLREYETCRATFQGYERTVRLTVGETGEVTPMAIFVDGGGPHPKTQAKIMGLFGLSYPRHWPPRTWPAHPLIEPNGQI